MEFFGFEITRRKGMQVGGHRSHDEHIVQIEDRLDRLEHHRKDTAVKTANDQEMNKDIAAILAAGVRQENQEKSELAEEVDLYG